MHVNFPSFSDRAPQNRPDSATLVKFFPAGVNRSFGLFSFYCLRVFLLLLSNLWPTPEC
jgi:hypothetical protein